jgi:3'-phosphoadenosine 5'-phosphosulfate sulfotransferase (PAPS reductase)/FAD synthetase
MVTGKSMPLRHPEREPMNVISSSYGNDSIALIQWVHEYATYLFLTDVTVAYCDTGWAAPHWLQRVERGEALAKRYGFRTVRCKSMGMPELVRQRKGWPGNGQQFCTAHLKGVPFLEWIDKADPECKATVLIGKRRAESEARRDTPEFIESSPYHGGRRIWHPLFEHSDAERNALLARADFEPLPHRSLECNPCVNANRADFLRLTGGEIERVNDLEAEIGKPMFRPKRFNAMGIHGVIAWAKDGRNRPSIEDEEAACAGLFGCGL